MNFEFRDLLSVGTLCVTILLAFIGQKIQITALKIESKIDTHDAVDKALFEQINKHFEASDARLTRLEENL